MTTPISDRIDRRLDTDPVEADLRALAVERFSASPEMLGRIESEVLKFVREPNHFDSRPRALQARRGNWSWPRRRGPRSRRLSGAMLGGLAALVVAGTTAFASAESVPGRPLFGLRLAVEEALLPAQSRADRIDAQLARLDRRLSEAAEVLQDADAAGEAIQAYRSTLPELRRLLPGAPAQARSIRESLDGQLRRIRGLIARLPADARPELESAADDATAVLASLEDHDGATPVLRSRPLHQRIRSS